MGILDNKISEEDRQRVSDIRNHPQYEAGFDDDFGGSSMGNDDFGGFGLSDDLNSLFDDGDSFGGGSSFGSDSTFGSGSSFGDNSFGGGSSFGDNSFGGGSSFGSDSTFGGGSFGGSSFGNSSPFGGNPFGGSTFGSPFGPQNGTGVDQQVAKEDTLDKAIDAGVKATKNIGLLLLELLKSFKLRNVDDIGYLSRNMIIVGAVMLPVSLVIAIIGSIVGVKFISFSGLSTQLILCGGLSLTSGVLGIGITALVLSKVGEPEPGGVEAVEDIPSGEDNFTEEFESNIGSEFDDLFGDDFDSLFNETSSNDDIHEDDKINEDEDEDVRLPMNVGLSNLSLNDALENIEENQHLSRAKLFETFSILFPTCTPNFADKTEIDKSSKDFSTLETICLKALSNLANVQLEELNSHLETAYESFFSYELRLKRINKVKKTDDLAREVEAYMRDSSSDDDVNATVDIEGDFYKIVVTKGESAIVTFGDVLKQKYCSDFFLDTKNKLPMITGIDELGHVILDDAKNFDTMLIAGKPRSGKSWYVLSILASLMLFNSPEDVQFCIIDPKESNLFKTMALMPHVCGLHNDRRILQILDDIIEVEAPRRKKLLADNRCDDIWALRKKGIQLPVLYVVIDEYITIINNLEADDKKEFDAKIQTLISQLPSQGIRLIFVPHRATGIVNKTNRTMIQFTACVRADTADVVDTLGIQKWQRALTQPGDIAVKNSLMKSAAYVRGAALTTDDGDNTIFIETAAKIFYKMGVDIPDMRNMRVATNRDEEYIKNELGAGTGNRVQFDADSLDNLEDFSVDNL